MDAPLPVVINRSGGTAQRLGDKLEPMVRKAFAATGRAIDLHLVDGDRIADTVRDCSGPRVAVGGGDGTLAGAAEVLAGQGRELAVLPLGTRNHFALQLGIPDKPEGWAAVAAHGAVEAVDVGRAGERLFLNNLSLGLYSRLVRTRERVGGPKWLGTIPASWHVVRRWRTQHFVLTVDGATRAVKTPLLFVGNNRYSLEKGSVGERASLTDGQLSLYAVRAAGPLRLAAMALRTLAGRADPSRDFAALAEARELRIEGGSPRDVSCDGELCPMTFPLDVRIEPRALKVVVPAAP